MGEKSWLRRRIKDGLHRGFQHAYETVKIDPARFLLQLRAPYGLPITNLQGVYSVEIARLDDLATRFIRSGMKVAAVEGAGLGVGGMLAVGPDLRSLAGMTLRSVRELSWLCGMWLRA